MTDKDEKAVETGEQSLGEGLRGFSGFLAGRKGATRQLPAITINENKYTYI